MKKSNTNPVNRLTIPVLYLVASQTESVFVDESEWAALKNFLSYSWLIVNDDFIITDFGDSAPNIFERIPEKLLHADFEQLLLHGSAIPWKQLGAEIKTGNLSGMTLFTKYETARGRILHTITTLGHYNGSGLLIKIYIGVDVQIGLERAPAMRQKVDDLSTTDRALVEAVRDYIMAHLDEPLPTTRALAQKFYTNEYTLKLRFRQAYGSSIYKYYNSRRLDRANDWIFKGAHTLQDIAIMSGFSTYRNFSSAFKKYTGRSPMAAKHRK